MSNRIYDKGCVFGEVLIQSFSNCRSCFFLRHAIASYNKKVWILFLFYLISVLDVLEDCCFCVDIYSFAFINILTDSNGFFRRMSF